MQRYNSPPSLYLPPSPSQSIPTMGFPTHSSESSLFDDKDYLDPIPLPFAPPTKPSGRRKRAFFATAALVSLLFLASYIAIQHRASDWFGADLEPIPFHPEDAELDVELPPNATYSITSPYSSVRGPPTPLFRGARLSVATIDTPDLTQYRQFIAR